MPWYGCLSSCRTRRFRVRRWISSRRFRSAMYPDARTQRQSRTGTIAARQQGLGLPAAIFVILILALIAVAVTELEQSGVQAKTYEIMSTRAFFAAESGAQAAVNRLLPPGGTPAACTANFFSANYTVAGLNGCSSAVSCR